MHSFGFLKEKPRMMLVEKMDVKFKGRRLEFRLQNMENGKENHSAREIASAEVGPVVDEDLAADLKYPILVQDLGLVVDEGMGIAETGSRVRAREADEGRLGASRAPVKNANIADQNPWKKLGAHAQNPGLRDGENLGAHAPPGRSLHRKRAWRGNWVAAPQAGQSPRTNQILHLLHQADQKVGRNL